jgi:predicted DNA-binding transcriptional regulator YafY
MTERIKKIFKKLYDNDNTSKDELAKSLNVSSKTIENTISDYKNEIIYDKKLKRYRYINLLPSFIDYSDLFYFFTNSISNQVIKYDFFSIQKKLNSLEDILVISTTELSSLTQMLVKCKVAINNNCILKIKYKGNKKFSEDKYIRPIHIISTGHIFYLYASYDKRNSKDIGKYRSFAINAIESIEVMEFTNEATLKKEIEGNAYGIYDPEKFVILTLDDIASRFFQKRRDN